MYKTTERVRQQALTYYYANRQRILGDLEKGRRAVGTPVRQRMTREERLARVRVCRCGVTITAPSLLLACQNVCARCQHNAPAAKARRKAWKKTPAGKAAKARGNRHHKDSPAHARAWVRQEKLKRGCLSCGARPQAALLHFHHRNPATKLFKIAWGVYHVSAKILRAEIAKCDVLCEDCHKTEH